MESQFYKNLLEQFINIDFPPMYQDLAKINGPISWYLSDSQNNLISVEKGQNQIIEVDIKSAFPTICRNLYGKDSEFVKQMESIEEKRGKNIFIATNLKGEPLRIINNISKITILGTIFDISNQEEINNIDVLELKKDGCIIVCNQDSLSRLKNINNSENSFTKFIKNHEFEFHIDEILKYLRCNQTSFILDKNEELKIKGKYKHCPEGLKGILKNIFIGSNYNQEEILEIYSKKYFNIVQKFNLKKILDDYYVSEGKAITPNGKYKNYNINLKINPRTYLKIYVFPIILSQIKKI